MQALRKSCPSTPRSLLLPLGFPCVDAHCPAQRTQGLGLTCVEGVPGRVGKLLLFLLCLLLLYPHPALILSSPAATSAVNFEQEQRKDVHEYRVCYLFT